MKTIILYATKYGAAVEIARRIAGKIEGAVIHDLKQDTPLIADFDCVIFGSSVYAGSIRKEAKLFLAQNADTLKEKKLGLFLCGIGADRAEKFFNDNFSKEILQKAKAVCFPGGIFDPKKANGLERFIIKLITKQSSCIDTIKDKKIEQFAQEMKS